MKLFSSTKNTQVRRIIFMHTLSISLKLCNRNEKLPMINVLIVRKYFQ
jgi:hypothetical protein